MNDKVDLRLLRRSAMTVTGQMFSEWCMAAWCDEIANGSPCGVPCECECHDEEEA